MNRVVKYLSVLFLILFGGLTVFLTSSVLFDLFGIREKEGNFVEFIVWINLISGLLFLWSAYSFWREKKEKRTFEKRRNSDFFLGFQLAALYL